ncbi:MAG: (2Fe-2S) ferredoxin domain-containing protein [Synechococcales cyanobacterium RU_4_20]|nr:(2Fe-2S) ferredoxin domain-containing protein [Synechococcales cyanobacterium RU_4_20]NJR67661.1 (2Fe-2S) ferredoxin domain-containing protein [Synechococcales cyanobacterium CRU_2_2]
MSCSETFSFNLVGQFLGYELKGYKLYRIHLGNAQGEYRLKLSGEARDDLLRAALQGNLQVGDWMQVFGLQEIKASDGSTKFKVRSIERTLEPPQSHLRTWVPPTLPGPKTQILVCQKSSCCKRGGKAICHALNQMLNERGLGDRVHLKATGCLKQCGKGPNLIVGKTRHHQVKVGDIPQILDAHFPPLEVEAKQCAVAKT